MNITTRRCVVRHFCPEDADALHEILSDEEVMKYIEPPFDRNKTEAFIREAGMCNPPLVYALVWRETGCVIGQVIFHPYEDNSREIGWILHRQYWGKGIAGEITKALMECAWEAGADSCVIECDGRQTASIKIAMKHGFAHEGTDGSLHIYRRKADACTD